MKKGIFGRKFKRDVNERKALFKGLMSSLVLNEKIETTESKAKAIKAELDKLVTRAKKDGVLARKLLSPSLSPLAMEKMIKDIAPRFAQRHGGYTKTVRLGKRFGDDTSMVLIEWTEVSQKLKVENQEPEAAGEAKIKDKPEIKNKKESKPKKEKAKQAEKKPRRRTKKSE
jgi:large subunit ribosomal protein L17